VRVGGTQLLDHLVNSPERQEIQSREMDMPPGSTVLQLAITNHELTDSRIAIDPDFRNPYTERWSFGFEQQPPQSTLLDVSYVGSESHRLTTKADWNPRLLNGVRLFPNFGLQTFAPAKAVVIRGFNNSITHNLSRFRK
jgi:hypothetical protein